MEESQTTGELAPSALEDRDDVIDRLNELIQLDFDAVNAYEDALEHIEDALVQLDLTAFRADHDRHIIELRLVIEQLGATPNELGRDAKGLLIEGLTKLRSITGTRGALRAMRMAERFMVRAYDKAVVQALPEVARVVVMRNLDDERRHLAMIDAHLTRLSRRDDDSDEEDFEDEEIDMVEGEVRPDASL